MINKPKLFLWSLYDFANSVVVAVFFLYWSQWVVVEKGVSAVWFNLTFTFSSLLLLLTVPVAAAIADKQKRRLGPLRWTTVACAVSFFMTGLIAVKFPEHLVWNLTFFTLGTYFYQFCFSYYNPMLEEVASPKRIGTASGWGQFGNWTGQIFGLLVTLPLVTGAVMWFSGSSRVQPLIPAAILYLIFALPLLLFFKQKHEPSKTSINIKHEYKMIISSSVKIFKHPNLWKFFLAYFFFNDAIITASNNFPLYIQNVFGVSDTTKSMLLILILITSAVGAPLSGWVADHIGFKKTLLGILFGWVIIFPALALTHDFHTFIIIAMIMGLWFGSIWTVTRAMLLELTPPHWINQSFTFYTLMERFATFIGPLSWGILVAFLPKTDNLNYRIAAASMAAFVLLGFLIARQLPNRIEA